MAKKGKGRPRAIESPKKMYELFVSYKEEIKSKPIKVHDFVGKDGQEVWRLRERPLTMEGFENYCFRLGIASQLDHYFANRHDAYSEFVSICRAIRSEIRQDQIEGGMASIYNPSITQRLNGLTDKQEMKVTQEQPLFGEDE